VVDHVVEDVFEAELHILVQVDAGKGGFVVKLARSGEAGDGVAAKHWLRRHVGVLSRSRGLRRPRGLSGSGIGHDDEGLLW